MSGNRNNRFENTPKAALGLIYGLITVALLIGVFFLAKAVRDEAKRGVERYIVLRERRPSSDIPQTPSKELAAFADGLERKPYPFRVDANGYIMPSSVYDKADMTIVFLGGSTTECMYMQEEERFPPLIGQKLSSTLGLKVNSLNGGAAGNNSLHCVLALQGKVLARKPQAVVLMECVNDLNFLMILGGYWNAHASRGIVFDKEYGPIKSFILKHITGRGILEKDSADEFSKERGQKRVLDLQTLVADYRKNIELFVYICRQHGIIPILMTQFNRFTETPEENLLRQMQSIKDDWGQDFTTYRKAYIAMQDAMRSVASEQNVLLIDLDARIPKTKEYLYDVVHVNAKGSALVADIVSRELEGVLKQLAKR